jgi:hypothetical protein
MYEGEKLAFSIPYLQLVLLTERNPELGTVVDILRKAKESYSAKISQTIRASSLSADLALQSE